MAVTKVLFLAALVVAAVAMEHPEHPESLLEQEQEHPGRTMSAAQATTASISCLTSSTPDEASKLASKAAEVAAVKAQGDLKAAAKTEYDANVARLAAAKTRAMDLALKTKTSDLAAAKATFDDQVKMAHAAAEKKRMTDMERVIAKKKTMEAEAIEKTKTKMELITRKHKEAMTTAGNSAKNTEETAVMQNKNQVAIKETKALADTKAEYETAMTTYRASLATIKTATTQELTAVTNAAAKVALEEKSKRDAKKKDAEAAALTMYNLAKANAESEYTASIAKSKLSKQIMEKKAENAVTIAKDAAWVDTIGKVMGGAALCN